LKNTLRILGTILMSAAAAFAGVTISSPAPGSTTGSPVHFVATGSMSGTVTAMQIYDGSTKKYQVSGSKIDTYLSLASGTHSITIKVWNSAGQSSYTKETINVSGSSTGSTSTAPSTAKTYSNVDQMTGWSSCGACAGIGGSGSVVAYSMKQNQSSPSMDGRSAVFYLGSGKAYSDALWWKQLGPNPAVSHLVYDTYFYYTDAGAPQSLEFDVNQALNGYKYIFGTQCSLRGSHTWDVWDNVNKTWRSTGIACSSLPTYKWNHLVWELERTGGKLHFISVTLNGVKHYVNRYYSPRASSTKELNVAFQMDGNYKQTAYKVWLDKTTLKAW
jgi:hypothetical protein